MLFTEPVWTSRVGLVECSSIENFEIYLFLRNIRKEMNDLSSIVIDMIYYLALF